MNVNVNERCIQNLDSPPAAARGGVLTIGNFDGVHLGHQEILGMARRLADRDGCKVVAMTFDPPPEQVLGLAPSPQTITSTPVKCRLLLETGADWVAVVPTTADMLALSPEEFVARMVVERFAPRHIVEGEDFAFGKGRRGRVETLRAAGDRLNFQTHVAPAVMLDFQEGRSRVSSTVIRQLILLGRVDEAAWCLGRPFALHGDVVVGQGQGRLLEFPTANLSGSRQICPADGVYAGLAEIDGKRFAAAISIGNKPTLGPTEERYIEAFLIDAEGDFYGCAMSLSFLRRLRGQEKFENTEALKAHIAADVEHVRQFVSRSRLS